MKHLVERDVGGSGLHSDDARLACVQAAGCLCLGKPNFLASVADCPANGQAQLNEFWFLFGQRKRIFGVLENDAGCVAPVLLCPHAVRNRGDQIRTGDLLLPRQAR
jgi:hypothetical protein